MGLKRYFLRVSSAKFTGYSTGKAEAVPSHSVI
jgi:hypothetical protein